MGDILFLAHRVPYPPDRGDKIRSYNLLRRLATLGRVHLATFAEDEADFGHAKALEPLIETMHVAPRTISNLRAGMTALVKNLPVSLTAFASPTLHAYVKCTLADRPIGTIFTFSGQMAQFVPAGPRRFVMDFVDMDSAKFAEYGRASKLPMRWVHRREARKLSTFERATARRADLSLFVSEAEAAMFRAASGQDDRIATLGNGVDLAYFDRQADFLGLDARQRGAGPLIIFTGQMDYQPNVEAVTSFARCSMPAIVARYPAARFAIVGRAPGAEIKRLAGPNICVTGTVPDIRSWLAAADVVVAPLRIARGVQNKILEAMAMRCAVVASPAAHEGIDAVAGRDLIVADAAGEAEAVCALLDKPAHADWLAGNARSLVTQNYGWDAVLAPLAEMVCPATGRSGASA